MKFEDSKTYKNLETALQGEALAHLKYQFYRSKIANTSKDLENKIDEIVHNEKEHGKLWFKILHNGEVPDDVTNIMDAFQGELYEHQKMYPEFAKIAYDEGFPVIGELFSGVADIEGQHVDEFDAMRRAIDQDSLFNDIFEKEWKCLNCGHIYIGKEAPEICPICKHPRKYFVRL